MNTYDKLASFYDYSKLEEDYDHFINQYLNIALSNGFKGNTILDIGCGTGASMLPLLENPKESWPDRNLFIHRGRWGIGIDPNENKYNGGAVRTQRWRLIFPKNSTSEDSAILFDISKDKFQTNNVTNQYPEVTKKLKKIYDQWWEETLPLLINENRKISDEFPLHTRFNKQLKESGISDWAPLEN